MHKVTQYHIFIHKIKQLAHKQHIYFSIQYHYPTLTIRTHKQTQHFNLTSIPPDLAHHYTKNAIKILHQKLIHQLTIIYNV